MEKITWDEYKKMDRDKRIKYVNSFIKPEVVIKEYRSSLGLPEQEWGDNPQMVLLGKVYKGTIEGRNGESYCFLFPYDPIFGKEIDFFTDNNDRLNRLQLITATAASLRLVRPTTGDKGERKEGKKPIQNPAIDKGKLNEREWVLVVYSIKKDDAATVAFNNGYIDIRCLDFVKVDEQKVNAIIERLGYKARQEEAEKEISETKERLAENRAELEKVRTELGKIQNDLCEVNTQIIGQQSQLKRVKVLEELGFEFESAMEESGSQPLNYNYSELIVALETREDDMKAALSHYQSMGLRVLDRFFSACFSGQLIILSGPSGTGKTTLPRIVAKLMGGICKVIPVQPNWTDQQDLFGFYNFMERRYISTEFLDCLMEANRNPEKGYFIVLDEMNLAHVEYYFANYLSKMELKDNSEALSGDQENDGRIHLYSRSDERELKSRFLEELREICKCSGITETLKNVSVNESEDPLEQKTDSGKTLKEFIDEVKENNPSYEVWFSKYRSFLDQMCHFPSSISLPSNVQIVGTINMDDTTKGLSPKVLDRSYVIEIPEETAYEGDVSSFGVYYAEKEEKEPKNITEPVVFIKAFINTVNKYKVLKLRFSKRLQDQFIRMAKSVYGEDDSCSEEFVDDFILSKILPAARCERTMIESTDHENLVNVIEGQDYRCLKHTIAKIESMYKKDMQTYDYWE